MAGLTNEQRRIGLEAIRKIQEQRKNLPRRPNPFDREPFRHEHKRLGRCVVCGREITEADVDGPEESPFLRSA